MYKQELCLTYKFLGVSRFKTILGCLLVESWRKEYNRFRPHSSLGYRPPALEAFEAEKLILGLVH